MASKALQEFAHDLLWAGDATTESYLYSAAVYLWSLDTAAGASVAGAAGQTYQPSALPQLPSPLEGYRVGPQRSLRSEQSGTGLQAHHLVEKRFADRLGLDPNEMLAVSVTREEHQQLTNGWRRAIGYSNSNNPVNTRTAGPQEIWEAAQQVYARHPELLRCVREQLGMP